MGLGLETVLRVGAIAEGIDAGPAAAAVRLCYLPIDYDKIRTILGRFDYNFGRDVLHLLDMVVSFGPIFWQDAGHAC